MFRKEVAQAWNEDEERLKMQRKKAAQEKILKDVSLSQGRISMSRI